MTKRPEEPGIQYETTEFASRQIEHSLQSTYASQVEQGNWTSVYEHYGEYRRESGFEATSLILQVYPEATVIHDANTAMVMGSVEAQVAMGRVKEILLSGLGWSGTGIELDAIRPGTLDATPMRMGDDIGARTAEGDKADLPGRADDLPLVFLGQITMARDQIKAQRSWTPFRVKRSGFQVLVPWSAEKTTRSKRIRVGFIAKTWGLT